MYGSAQYEPPTTPSAHTQQQAPNLDVVPPVCQIQLHTYNNTRLALLLMAIFRPCDRKCDTVQNCPYTAMSDMLLQPTALYTYPFFHIRITQPQITTKPYHHNKTSDGAGAPKQKDTCCSGHSSCTAHARSDVWGLTVKQVQPSKIRNRHAH
jgi:hypothetical protein